jgi:1-phosphofructokinase family hexose kinase
MLLSVCPNPSVDTFALVDDFRLGESNRINQELKFPGGKGTHVALAAKELGLESALLGFFGGASGSWMRKECEGYGVQCPGVSIAGENRRCYTLRSSSVSVADTELLCPGPEVSETEVKAFFDAYEAQLEQCDAVALSGSWPTAELAEPYGRMVELARERGKKTILDCSGVSLSSSIESRPTAIHLNFDEAKTLTRRESIGAMLDYFSNKVEIIALTCGAEGLYLAKGSERIHASVKIDRVVSAVGSGDCLVAGLAKAMMEELSLADTARLCVACGAANCLREELGMLHAEDVKRLYGEVELKI